MSLLCGHKRKTHFTHYTSVRSVYPVSPTTRPHDVGHTALLYPPALRTSAGTASFLTTVLRVRHWAHTGQCRGTLLQSHDAVHALGIRADQHTDPSSSSPPPPWKLGTTSSPLSVKMGLTSGISRDPGRVSPRCGASNAPNRASTASICAAAPLDFPRAKYTPATTPAPSPSPSLNSSSLCDYSRASWRASVGLLEAVHRASERVLHAGSSYGSS